MKFNKFYVSALLGCATFMLMPSCANDDIELPGSSNTHDSLRFKISVIGTGSANSRDGYDDKDQGQVTFHEPHTENGSYNETALKNVLLVIYDTPLNAATDSDPGHVVKTLYIPDIGLGVVEDNHYHDAEVYNADGVTTTVVEKNVPIARTYAVEYNDLQGFDQLFTGSNATRSYYAIALANVGNLSDAAEAAAANSTQITIGMTVLQLRDYVYNGPLYEEPAGGLFKIKGEEIYTTPEGMDNHPTWGDINSVTNCKNFAMSGMNEITVTAPTVTVETNLPPDNHKKTTTTLDLSSKPMLVQRLAARVDISFGIQAVWSDAWYANDHAQAGEWTGGGTTHYYTDTKKYLGYGTPNGPAGKKEDVPTIYSVSGGPNELNIGDIYYPYDMDVWGHAGLYRFPVYDEAVYQATGKFRRLTDVTFYMEDIELENVVTHGSYLFERSTGTPSYLGNAGKWVEDYPTNFIPSVSSRNIQAKLTMANGDYDEDGAAGRRYTEYRKDGDNFVYDSGNPVPNKTVYPSVDDIPMPVTLIMSAHRWEGLGQYTRFSTLAYIGENTFSDPINTNNKYTTMRLSGYANFHDMHFDGVEDHDNDANATDVGNVNRNRVAMSVTYKLRHSFGTAKPNHRMCFGVVRNTVYRTFIQFFYTGSNLVAREWYYDSDSGTYKDVTYPVNIYNHVVEDPDPNHQGNPPANT